MIPYDDITDAADRGWTFRLLDRLVSPDLPDAEVEKLIGSLQAVSDPRSLASLEAIVCDTSRPLRIRRAASSAFRGMQYLHRHDTLGTHATETLDTFVRHAEPADAVRRLGWIAGDHGRREGLRVAGLLREPPVVTWALHIALLGAVADLGLPVPDIGPLRGVDNLHVQKAVAGFGV